jgi:ubiquinone/menaquinone biosynthesis C-methylase UbiE
VFSFNDTKYDLNFYEKSAQETIQRNSSIPPDHFARIFIIAKLLKDLEFENCLEIGPSQSPIITFLKKRYPWYHFEDINFYGIELTRSFCKLSQKQNIYTPIQGTWYNLPLKDKTVDVSIWSEGPEHCENPEEVFKEITRVTKKYVITSVPAWKKLVPGHVKVYNRHSFRKLLGSFFPYLNILVVGDSWLIAFCYLN